MKKRKLEPRKHTYTSLFNACANAPKSMTEDNLKKARNLRKQLKEKQIPLTIITYNAMIKGKILLV